MTLDEAIIKHIQIADSYHKAMPNYAEATDHRQLAEWLQELRAYRKLEICGNCRHYVSGTTHFGECHVTSDIEPCVVSVNQTACDTFLFRNGE